MSEELITCTVRLDMCLVAIPDKLISPHWEFIWIAELAEKRPAGKLMTLLCLRITDGLVQDIETRSVHAGDLRDGNRQQFLEYLMVLCEAAYVKHSRNTWQSSAIPWYKDRPAADVAYEKFFTPRKGRRGYALVMEALQTEQEGNG